MGYIRKIKEKLVHDYCHSNDEILVWINDYLTCDGEYAERKNDLAWVVENAWNIGLIQHDIKSVGFIHGYAHFSQEISKIAEELKYKFTGYGYTIDFANKSVEITSDYPDFKNYSPTSKINIQDSIYRIVSKYRKEGFEIKYPKTNKNNTQ